MKVVPFLAVGLALAISSYSAELEVVVKGVDKVEGNVRVGIYNSEEMFRVEPMDQSETVEVTEELVTAEAVVALLKDLEPGVYAIAVVWDQNKNEQLDVKGPFKRPIEPTGFSNDPKMLFGPPKFEECVFTLTEEGGKLEINLQEL